MSQWALFYTADSISSIAFNKPYGLLEAGSDVANLLTDNRFVITYLGFVALAPWLDLRLLKNPLLLWLNRKGIAQYNSEAVLVALKLQEERNKELQAGAEPREDILDSLLQTKHDYPDFMNDDEVHKINITVIFAGGDTTALHLTAIFRYILKHPHVYEKLQEEIDRVSEFSYTHPEKSPYLDAVIKETGRMHPVVRFSFERKTPPQGIQINGEEIPGDTNIGVNAWAVHRDPTVWGEDVDTFRPERWLNDPAEARTMARKLLLFGQGKYQCLGMHIAYTEIYRVVPAFLKTFKVGL